MCISIQQIVSVIMSSSQMNSRQSYGVEILMDRFNFPDDANGLGSATPFNRIATASLLDVRALALFRLGLASLLLCDYLSRLGILLRCYDDLFTLQPGVLGTSLEIISLWIFGVISAGLLFIGFRTRFILFLSWAFYCLWGSIAGFHPTSAEALLGQFLFWSLFLPLGARYSVDRAMNTLNLEYARLTVFSNATLAFTLQLIWLYAGLLVTLPSRLFHPISTATSSIQLLTSVSQPFGQWQFSHGMTPPLWISWLGGAVVFISLIEFRMSGRRLRLPDMSFYLLSLFLSLVGMIIFPQDLAVWGVMVMGLSVWIPGSFWNFWAGRLPISDRQSYRIYYDGDCRFCKKGVRLLLIFCLLEGVTVQTAQSDPDYFQRMQRHHSWIVVTPNQHVTYEYQAFLALLPASPLGKIILPMAQLTLLKWLGTKLYRYIAHHREALSWGTRWMTWRPDSLNLPWWQQTLVTLLLAYSLIRLVRHAF